MKEIESPYLATFSETPAARKIIRSVASEIRKPEEFTIDGELAGKVFQDIAYDYISARIPEYQTLLSPEETLIFFKKLYPSKELVENRYGLSSLRGVAVPDGLLFDQRLQEFPENPETFSAVYEYTLVAGLSSYVSTKARAIDRILAEFPFLFNYAEVKFVVPKDRGISVGLEKYGKIEKLPFTAYEFAIFLNKFALKIQNTAR